MSSTIIFGLLLFLSGLAGFMVGTVIYQQGKDLGRKSKAPPAAKEAEPLTCKDCGSTQFYSGPTGGLCENVMCMKCGSAYNIAIFCGNVISMDRISNRYWWAGGAKLLDGTVAQLKQP